MLNYQTVDFMAGQLADQYATQRQAGYSYKNEEDLPKFFRGQAAKLAANGVTSIYDVQQSDGGLVNSVTGEPIKKVELKPDWETNPEAFAVKKPVSLEDRGKFTRWGIDYSVDGQADYGISFENGVPVYTPFWKDTATQIFGMDLEDAVKTAIAATALYYGGQYLLSPETAAASSGASGAASAGAGTGTAISGAGLTSAEMAALKGAEFYGSLGAPVSTAVAVPASQLAYPALEVASIPNASLAPTSFQAALPGMGIETAASAAPFTAAPGSFQAAVPSLLAPAAATAGGIGATEALRTAAVANALLNPPAIPQQGLLGRSGGQPRGVDFSPLYQNNIVGLLPLAERYRRSLI